MLIVMERNATREQIHAVNEAVKALGLISQPIPGETRVAIGVLGNQGYVDEEPFRDLPGIQELIHVTKPFKLVSRDFHPADTVVSVGGVKLGWGQEPVVIAGPCAVESRDQVLAAARAVKAAGKIHTDIERGFIRAEIYKYDDLVKLGNYKAIQEKGLLSIEGKDYEMKDGDVAYFRFNV